jgi:hypothetical protein
LAQRLNSLDIDANIQKAIGYGEANKRTIELAQNWCGHIEIVRWGGTGLVEIETGLPIGHRYFKCPHASAAGMAGMDLASVALDFYDRNCKDCTKRLPVRFPNLYTELVTKRDEARHRDEEIQREASERSARALEDRAARRAELAAGCNPAIAGIFARIDELDRDPTGEKRKVLLEAARTVPSLFDSRVQEALFQLADAGGFFRTDAALEILGTVSADDQRLCDCALRALARQDGVFTAADIVSERLDDTHAELLKAALPSLIRAAAPIRGFVPFSGSPGKPQAVLAGYRLFPDLVEAAVRNALAVSHKYERIKACEAVSIIARAGPAFGLKVADAVISSLDLPDDHYGEEGSAEGAATLALAQIMLDHPKEVDSLLQREITGGSEELRASLFRVYENILSFRRLPDGHPGTKTAQELAYQRFVDLLVTRPGHELLTKVTWFFRDEAKRFPDLLALHAETLLGAAALIATDLDEPSSPLLELDVRPDPLKALEKQGQRQSSYYALLAIVESIGFAAARNPKTVGVLLVETFEKLDPRHGHLRAALVEGLGRMARDASALPIVVPALYQAMMSGSALVRAASARAYVHLAKHCAEDLPPLVHESFLLLLMDPYVAVHSAALDALREIELPKTFTPRVVGCLGAIISAYRQSRSDSDILSKAIQRFLELADPDLISGTRNAIVSIVDCMPASAATDVVLYSASALRGASKFGELLTKLISDPETNEYHIDDLVDELEEIPPDQILALSDQIKTAASTCASHDIEITDDLIAILSLSGAWPAAVAVARDATERLSNDTWDRPRKLRSELRQVAAEIEAGADSGDAALVLELAKRWRELKQEVERDDEENKAKRNPLLGLQTPDSSD